MWEADYEAHDGWIEEHDEVSECCSDKKPIGKWVGGFPVVDDVKT